MERHNKREYSEEVNSADLVYCIRIDSNACKILRNIPVVGLSLIFPPTTRLSKKAPDFGEAKALMDTMREEGIPPNVFT